MCGITGYISWREKVNKELLEVMTDELVHRGPDGRGVWLNDKSSIGLGHRRLSIIDLTDKGAQPMHYENRFTITYNGEIYNYLELRSLLEGKGHRFASTTDTEVIMAAFAEYGYRCLDHFEGMFALAIWDDQKEELFCARDRFGEKPFYYHIDGDRMLFASEMKSLFKAGVPTTKNLKRYYYYLLYNVAEDPCDKTSTFYRDISQLEPAHYLVVKDDGTIDKHRYWDIDLDNNSSLDFQSAQAQFYDLFGESVAHRLRSDVHVGSSLSGGLDSSSIVMMIDKLKGNGQTQSTFSARFEGFEKDEGYFMERVIEQSNVNPQFVFPTVDSLTKALDSIFYHQEEPIGSLSVAVQYAVMQKAAEENVKVLLDGQGADEVLAGYGDFWSPFFLDLYKNNKKQYNKEIRAFTELQGHEPVIDQKEFFLRTYAPGLYHFLRKRRASRDPRNPYFLGIHPDLVEEFQKEPNPLPKCNTLKEQLYFYTCTRGLGELLRYADRNSMAHSVEVRLPFLNHKLVEFVFSLPSGYLMHSGWTKYILRHSMENILPKEIAWRKDKIGFEPPQKSWEQSDPIRTKISNAIEELQRDKILVNPQKEQHWQYLALTSLK